MSDLATQDLEQRAAHTRRELHASFDELKGRVIESLDVERQLTRHALSISAVAALTAAAVGYGFAGFFPRR